MRLYKSRDFTLPFPEILIGPISDLKPPLPFTAAHSHITDVGVPPLGGGWVEALTVILMGGLNVLVVKIVL